MREKLYTQASRLVVNPLDVIWLSIPAVGVTGGMKSPQKRGTRQESVAEPGAPRPPSKQAQLRSRRNPAATRRIAKFVDEVEGERL